MRPGTRGAIALAALALFSGQAGSAQQPPAFALSSYPSTVVELRTWDGYITQAERSGHLRVRRTDRDPLLPSRVVERFQQFHDGIRIWGADIVRDSERGVPISVFGTAVTELALSVEPSIGLGAARESLLGIAGGEAVLLTALELVILPLDGGDHRLAYTAAVAGSAGVLRVFVDAQTGAELMRYSEIQTQQAAVGTGTGVLGDRKKLSVESNAGTFVAFDRHRPPVIQTFDMRGNLARTKLLFSGLANYTVSDLASDSDNIWSDVSVVDAHVHVSWTYDYYFKRFGRSGLDGRNAPLNIVVNAVPQQGALSLPPADLDYAVNASWCPSCGPQGQGRMFFGNGLPPGEYFPGQGKNYRQLAGGLDVAAHELTHAVTSATSNLVYRNESGALNEAFSDIMGKSVEFYYRPPGTAPGQADYVIGKDVVRAVLPGVLNGIRSMANPGLYGDPDHYSRRYVGNADGGGVHRNSGIANHAFYLAVESGTNRTSGVSVQGVGAANREQIERVFYRAFTLLMPADSTFLTARVATIQAARDLNGAGSAVERAVTQAWTAVGVPDPASLATVAGTVAQGSRSVYTITMNANGRYEAILTWARPDSIDLDLYLTRVGCPAADARCVLVASESPDALESISWPVRAGERYSLTIVNFDGGSTPFTFQHWITAVNGVASGSRLGGVETVYESRASETRVSK